MNSAPSSAATKVRGLNVPPVAASAGPTSTGATAAGSVRGRAAISQMCSGLKDSGPLGELREVGLAALLVGLAPLLRLLGGVEEEVGVVRELLDAAQPVLVGMEARLQQSQRERREREHLPAPRHGLVLEPVERPHRVHEPHLQRLPRVVAA